jgi:uncharacterized membrane protein YhhN
MPNRVTWPILALAVAAGVSFVGSWFIPLPEWAAVAWKGSGVALLAFYANQRGRPLLAAVLAFGALGDVLIETHGLIIGALAFLAGHAAAMVLYLRNLRPLSGGERFVALAMALGVVAVAYALPLDRAEAPAVAAYAVGLGAMAAAAWASRFPRWMTALGAWMFVASDLLIFLRTGRPAAEEFWMALAVWGLYFAGQTLICLGVTRAPANRPVDFRA